jgi:hypothetical protein
MAHFPCFNTAIKADSLVGNELQQGLKAAFEKLRAGQAVEPDWRPGSDDMVQDLVHPSMYPFVYGTSASNINTPFGLVADTLQGKVRSS